jgi:membrane-associated phospholipid phosphatase
VTRSWPSGARLRARAERDRRPPGGAAADRLSSGRELALFGSAYLVYLASRWALAGDRSIARAHARSVLALERALHVAVERPLQHALGSGVAGAALAEVYLLAQLLVAPAALVALYRCSPPVYRRLRTTVALTWLIAVPVFVLFPTAPPRLAGTGIQDTVSREGISLAGGSTLFYNPYAAMPSLHVGLAFAVGIAVAGALRPRWARALALLWGPLVAAAVLATGNHFLLDAVAGVLAVALAHGLSRLPARRPRRPRSCSRSAPRAEPGPRGRGCPPAAVKIAG